MPIYQNEASPRSIGCRICGSTGNHKHFQVMEMQFGSKDEFTYFECASCGGLQIAQIPANLNNYYPKNYYSFTAPQSQDQNRIGPFRRFLRAQRSLFYISGKNIIGRLIARLTTNYFAYPWYWFTYSRVTPTSTILDVGCGDGALLRALRDQGFINLQGIDPFIEKTIHEQFLHIEKTDIHHFDGQYDLVMFHHSLEHTADLHEQLLAAARLCKPNGTVLIRIPIADGYGWRYYKEHWVALDAPRHLVIPTRESLKTVAQSCGLILNYFECDSEVGLFWGSELYKRGIPYFQPDGQPTMKAKIPFSDQEMDSFRLRAQELNEIQDGDIACFIFRKAISSI